METKLLRGDYVPDGLGGVVRLSGSDALLQRVLYRLTARRGQFPLLPQLGSRLHLLGRQPPAQRAAAARQYVAEALTEEDISVTDVLLSPASDGHIQITAELEHQGTALSVTLTV